MPPIVPPTIPFGRILPGKVSRSFSEAEQQEIVTNQQGTAFLISSATERTSFTIVTTDIVEGLFIREDEKQL